MGNRIAAIDNAKGIVENKFWRLYVPYLLYGLLVLVPFDLCR